MELSKQQLICRVNENLQIWADERQYILRRDNNQNKDWFYSELEPLLRDIFELKLKECAINNEEKTLLALGKAISDATEFISGVIRPILEGYQPQEASTERERE